MTSPAHSAHRFVAEQRRAVDARDPRVPNSFVGAPAFATTLVVAVAIARMANGTPWQFQLSVMAAAVAVSSWWCRPLPSLFVSVCGWLALNGIDVNGNGQLGWSGLTDAVRAAVLVSAALLASSARAYTLRELRNQERRSVHLHLVRQGGAPHA